jgi:hypothetical protein
MPKAKKLRKVTLGLPEELLKRAKHAAVDEDRDLQDIVADALTAYLSKKGGSR